MSSSPVPTFEETVSMLTTLQNTAVNRGVSIAPSVRASHLVA